MNPEDLRRVTELVQSALERSPACPETFLASVCMSEQQVADAQTLTRVAATAGVVLASRCQHAEGTQACRAGDTLAHYEIVEWLGAGGMGEVFKARDVALGRSAALKRLPARFTPDLRRRLLLEAESSAKLQHPAIATFYETGEWEGEAFIAMEFVAGETLRTRLNAGAVPSDEALRIARCLLEALEHAHAAGIIHCDIKPENIMITGPGTAKLLDFGLARQLFAPGATPTARAAGAALRGFDTRVAGTLGYMAPEQLLGHTLDVRTDVFQVGLVLYEMLTGRRAMVASSPVALLAAVLHEDLNVDALRSCGIPTDLCNVIHRATARDSTRRHPTAAALLRELDEVLQDGVSTALPQTIATAAAVGSGVSSDAARSSSLEAQQSYARARHLLNHLSKGSVEQAIELLERAAAIDAEFVPALAGLAWAYGFRSIATTDPADLERAYAYAERALERDPRNADAHMWRAYVLLRRAQYEDAADAARRSAQFAPANATAPYFAGSALMFAGRSAEALPFLQRSLELDARVGMAWLALGAAHLALSQLREAHSSFVRARRLEGLPVKFPTAGAAAYVAEVLRLQGHLDEARAEAIEGLDSSERSDHAYRDFFRGHALVVLGRTALEQGDTAAARVAFHQVLGQASGRPRTRSCGQLVVQALAGLAVADNRPELLEEGERLLASRAQYNFEPFFGALDEQTRQEIAVMKRRR